MSTSSSEPTAGAARERALKRQSVHADKSLCIGGISSKTLVEDFGSPLYVFDARIIREQYGRLTAALGPRLNILHCLKANPNLAIAKVLKDLGAGAEVASAGEIKVALAAGHRGSELQFAGPGKGTEDLQLACEVGLGSVNLESVAEYEALIAIAGKSGQRPSVSIRVNPKQAVAGSRMIMGGASKKFGVDADEVAGLAQRILDDDCANLRGLHVYAGTQCFDADAWVANARALLELAREVEQSIGQSLSTINFGGGFGVAYYDSDPLFDVERAGAGIQDLIAADARPERQYFVELGRYLVADCGVYLTRVIYLKESLGKQHAILDGGMHHHAAAAGVGAIIRRAYPIAYGTDVKALATDSYVLGGPLCTPADELAVNAQLPRLEQGDLVAFLVSGAYGLTFSSTMFLSHPTPAELLIDDGVARVVRQRGCPEDALRGQCLFADGEENTGKGS